MGWFNFFFRRNTGAASERSTTNTPKANSKTVVSPLGNRTSHTASGTEITTTTTGRKIFKTTGSTDKGTVTKTYTYDPEDLKGSK